MIKGKTYAKSITQTQTIPPEIRKSPTKQCSHRSLIHPLKSVKDRPKNLSPKKPELIKQNREGLIDQSGKMCMNTKVYIAQLAEAVEYTDCFSAGR